MKKPLSLRVRIAVVVAALVLVTAGFCLVTLWYVYQTDSLLSSAVDRDFSAVSIAQQLTTDLVMQKGFTTYFFLDGNTEWLRRLDTWHTSFRSRLDAAHAFGYGRESQSILKDIERRYAAYSALRSRVIGLYRDGDRQAGAALHRDARGQFIVIQKLCSRLKQIHEQKVSRTVSEVRRRSRFIHLTAYAAMAGAVAFSALLVYMLFTQILRPIRQLINAAGSDGGAGAPAGNEMNLLQGQVYGLLEDVSQTRTRLEKSRRTLARSEKLALVGRLAAGIAHSIRNPLTSVKMRLFSLRRTVNPDGPEKEDFDVISTEIDHIESIVSNFLEFSRPPRMKLQRVSPSDVVDTALQLVRHRLETGGIDIKILRRDKLPPVTADPSQLKEVFINILLNGCDAMQPGGVMIIREQERELLEFGRAAVISFSDSGHGMAGQIRQKIFQPFFTTRDDGTGLGLSIASRIIEEHGGSIAAESEEGKGATFTITLPTGQVQHGQNTDSRR